MTLSTHIVEDVSDLCPRIAVLVDGRVQLEGAPLELIRATPRKDLDDDDRPQRASAVWERYEILSTRLFAGRTILHMLSDRGRRLHPIEGSADRPSEHLN